MVVVVVRLDLMGGMAMLMRLPAVARLIVVMLVIPILIVALRVGAFVVAVAARRGVRMLVDVRVRVRMFVAVVVDHAAMRMGMRMDMGMRVLVLVTVFAVVGHVCQFSLAGSTQTTAPRGRRPETTTQDGFWRPPAGRVASAPAAGLV